MEFMRKAINDRSQHSRALKRVQSLAPETDSMAGVQKRGIRAHVVESGVLFSP